LKTYNYLAAMLLVSSCFCFASAQSPSAAPKSSDTSLSVIGTPDDPGIARQIFPDVPDQSNDLLIAAGSADDTVRIGVRGHESTVQVNSDGANIRGTFSIDGVPLKLTAKAPTGSCTKPEFVLSTDGLTVCDMTTHLYHTKYMYSIQ
jgi:hypothetical protein